MYIYTYIHTHTYMMMAVVTAWLLLGVKQYDDCGSFLTQPTATFFHV